MNASLSRFPFRRSNQWVIFFADVILPGSIWYSRTNDTVNYAFRHVNLRLCLLGRTVDVGHQAVFNINRTACVLAEIHLGHQRSKIRTKTVQTTYGLFRTAYGVKAMPYRLYGKGTVWPKRPYFLIVRIFI